MIDLLALRRWILTLVLASSTAGTVASRATTVAVPVHIWAEGNVSAGLSLSGSFLESAPGAADSYATTTVAGSGQLSVDLGTVRMEPGRGYQVMLGGGGTLSAGAVNVVPPPGFYAEIEKVVRNRYLTGYGVVVVHILPHPALPPRPASTDVSQATGKIDWRVSLGSLRNGSSAGEIALIDAGFLSDWSPLYTPALLDYEALSTEVQVYRQGGWLKNIIANETAVDVVSLSPTAYELRFYNPAQLMASSSGGPPYNFGGQPYTVYRLEQDGGPGATKLKITRSTFNIPNATATGIAPSRVEEMTIERAGTAWPNFTWTYNAWTVAGQTALVQRTVDSSGSASDRLETVAVRVPGGQVATSASRNLTVKPWGEAIVSEKIGAGAANVPTADFVYYEDAAQPGAYSFLKSVTTGGGGWEAYEYHDATVANSYREGTVKYRYQPYLDAPATPSLIEGAGVVTYFDYAADAFGFMTRPALRQSAVNGVVTAKSTTAYAETIANGLPLVTATTRDFSDAINYLESTTQFYKENISDTFFRGQIHSTVQPDGLKVAYAHQRGFWEGGVFTISEAAGTGFGLASRNTVITGSSDPTAGALYPMHDGYDIDDLYLVDGKSTMQVTIRDSRALVVRTETHIRVSGAWQEIAATDLTYNFVGQAVGRTTSNGGRYDASYDGRLLTSQTDELGVQVSYTYDGGGRVQTATKAGGPTTAYSYDAAGHVTATVLSAPGTSETIVSLQLFDDAGRIIGSTAPGLAATLFTYDVANRTLTTTSPGGAASVQATYVDGRLKSLTGSALIGQYFSYSLEPSGQRMTQVNSGDWSSPRLQKSWSDWLGRPIRAEQPGFSPSAQAVFSVEQFYELGTGHLYKTKRAGYAPTRFEYDQLGGVVRSGLDVDDNGLVLASNDRIGENETVVEAFNGAWWLKTTIKGYRTLGVATPVVTSVSRTRLTGHPVDRLAESQLTDVEGNVATTMVEIDRTNKTLTTKTTLPGLANSQTSVVVNGLTASATGNDGLTTILTYDALSRAWKTTDSRNNTVTTSYYPGTVFPSSVTDATGATSTIGYDASGRVSWTQNALGHNTRSDYNLRGQLIHQWGDATLPVSYSYDAYGDCITLSTYRNASANDTLSWPASTIGAADITTSTYDSATGMLWKKTDALGQSVEFDYNLRGQIAARTWARGVTTNFAYDVRTGELSQQTYTDGTPAVAYTYGRTGQVSTVNDAIGQRTFTYDPAKPWRLASESLPSSFGGLAFTELYEESGVMGRSAGFKLGALPSDSSAVLEQNYSYTTSGRFDSLATRRADNAFSAAFQYRYEDPNSSLITGYTNNTGFTVSRTYEAQRDVWASLGSSWSDGVTSTSLAKFEFTTDALGQRKTAKQSGTAFEDYYTGAYSSVFNHYTYNARGELETTAMYRGDAVPDFGAVPPAASELPGRRFQFRYDGVGNRTSAGVLGDTVSDDQYSTNALNQYTTKSNNTIHVTGTAATSAKVAVSGATTASKKDRAWVADFLPANVSSAVAGTLTTYAALPRAGAGGADLIRTDATKNYFIAKAVQTFGYDADGNMTHDSVWDYTYDGENRLVAMQHRPEVIGAGMITVANARRLEFQYDYVGRRVAKVVKGGWNGFDYPTTLSYGKFIYDGWNLVAEYTGAGATTLGTLLRVYTWGLDLAGSLTVSGGVGALVQLYDAGTEKTYLPTYDGNGNVVAMVNAANGALEAVYEYSPFGELLRSEGAYATTNPIRFSTKYTDQETGLSYYGHRYYSAILGRFINRDPIEEAGGLNLYGFCGNDGVNCADYLGMTEQSAIQDRIRSIMAELNQFGGDHAFGQVTFLMAELAELAEQLSQIGTRDLVGYGGSAGTTVAIDLTIDNGTKKVDPVRVVPVDPVVPTIPTVTSTPRPHIDDRRGNNAANMTLSGPIKRIFQAWENQMRADGEAALEDSEALRRQAIQMTEDYGAAGHFLRIIPLLAAGADIYDFYRGETTSGRVYTPLEWALKGVSVTGTVATIYGAGSLRFTAPESVIPRGFESVDQFNQATAELRYALAKSGIEDASIGVRGSSVEGVSYRSGRPFGPASDIDFFVESDQVTQGLKTSPNIPGFVHPNAIHANFDPIAEWSEIWSTNLGRKVSVGGFQSGTVPTGRVIKP